uniref:Protein kinase domain-containing protein n=1 Tax=Peronospora matthiolae TaxID=2874970 RepID=A0AAV1USM7_9STRA
MSMQALELYSDASCDRGVSTSIALGGACSSSDCSATIIAGSTYYAESSCLSDVYEYTQDFFDETPYLLVDMYAEPECSTYVGSSALAALGECVAAGSDDRHVVATLFTNGSALVTYYLDQTCTLPSSSSLLIPKGAITNHPCSNGRKYYSSLEGRATNGIDNSNSSESKDGISGVSITGIVVALVLLVVVASALLYKVHQQRRRSKRHPGQDPTQLDIVSSDGYEEHESPVKLQTSTGTGLSMNPHHRHAKIWDDDVVVAARIPRDQVKIEELLSRGGYGEVYIGRYKGSQVAVKMLLPEKKKAMSQVNAFLCEVKLMACLDHPRIVSFIGVAWDQLVDICVVSEYMSGGDLKALLTEYENRDHPVGFDHLKVKIAFHVAIALAYLHSCSPPVIHRDLKSKNILLDEAMDAKVTDFGISRERIDATMTGGVGTSFWMAPEVMMGERYDDKVDMFSFGVVLSELDSHVLPYASVGRSSTNRSSGTRNLPSAAILQMVAAGVLRVEFSEASPRSIVDLGLACVSLDPNERPTAAEAVQKLRRILTEEV